MRTATLIAAAILFASFESCAVAEAPPRELQTEQVEKTQAAPARGLLYEMRTGAYTVYLFGTLHVGKPEFYPLSRQVNLALADSQRLYLEVNLTDTTIVNADTAAA